MRRVSAPTHPSPRTRSPDPAAPSRPCAVALLALPSAVPRHLHLHQARPTPASRPGNVHIKRKLMHSIQRRERLHTKPLGLHTPRPRPLVVHTPGNLGSSQPPRDDEDRERSVKEDLGSVSAMSSSSVACSVALDLHFSLREEVKSIPCESVGWHLSSLIAKERGCRPLEWEN